MTVKIFSGGAVQGLVGALSSEFKQATGATIDGEFSAVGGMRDRVLAGEAVDLVILTRSIVEDLVAKQHVHADTVADVGLVATCLAVRSGDSKPPIGDHEELRSTLLSADEIHMGDPERSTGGIHFTGVLSRLGIGDQVRGHLHTFPNGVTAMTALASSTAKQPIGCTQMTEVLSTDGVDLLAPLPTGYDLSTTYTVGVSTTARNPDVARILARLLTSPDKETARRAAGFTN